MTPARKCQLETRRCSTTHHPTSFEKTATGWKQVDASSLPAHVNWTVAFDGKNLGEVESQAGSEEGFTPVQNI